MATLKKSLTLGAFAITLTRSKGFASRLRSKLDVPLLEPGHKPRKKQLSG
jgi:hypothetical protein